MPISLTFNLNMQELTDVFFETRGNDQDYLFKRNLSLAYEKIVYWKKILFLLPSGLGGKSFIDEISRLMSGYTSRH